ncbi:ral guanine nucleotide dissociation stimulator-like 1 [Plectropomus leopardus]|uniref:ral guanine nucleotide dissociation stimulator-like 1 n=1 Tax=Plectropomus leopardus TaxID=160734 RepID=UPI001C4BF55C|nr:ral guanine nucleotide dissociation stimulator-like 1 [Plectropomus leopardus]
MRIIIPVCGGADGGESRGLRSRVGRMKKLLWLRPSHCVDVHTDTEPGVWLTGFQSLDTDGQCEDPVQEWGEEEEDGAVFGITLRREPVLPSSDTSELPTAFSFVQYHTVKVRRLKAATLERLVTHLLDAEHQEPDYLRVFLSTYRAFTSTSTLIELLFQRDDSMANLDKTICPRSTLPPVIRLWLEEYSEDFHDPPQYQALRLLCVHLRHRLCFRRLAHTAETLLKRLQEQDCSQPASQHANESSQQENREQEDGGETSSKEEDKRDFMDFPVREVAEQLTRLDAELFVKVVPFHCLGCVWSQRDKKENRHLAPSVRATISQFNAVTNRVITSLLCPSSPSPSTSSPISSPSSSSTFLYPSTAPNSPRCFHTSPAHRARIIERWIAIAQECRQIKNFSSLRAILSALQSNAVYRLKKTWAAVSRENMAAFDHLCETFPDENCVLTSREILVETVFMVCRLRTVSDSSLRKTHADQISVSSSGSSSSDMEELSAPQPSPLRLKLKSLSGSLHNVTEDFSSSSMSSSSPSLSSSSSHPDLSSSSLVLSPEPTSSSCSPQALLPVYNKQVADSCIIRVSVESVSNGNVYKSILLTSQDHTPQVIQRALEKHNMEDVSCQYFNLCQMLNNGKELQIPDKANVFYAMCTSANYDFVLRQRWRSHGRHLGSSSSPGAQPKSCHAK